MTSTASLPRVDRRAFVARLIAAVPQALVVTGLGSAAYDVYAAGDRDRNYYLWGVMGGASALGLGLALAQPDRPVVVVTGDGEMLMGLGSLATVGAKAVQNLAVAVLDNEAFGETGGQRSHTAFGIDLPAVALGCRFREARTARTMQEVGGLRELLLGTPGPVLGVVKVAAGEMARVLPERDGHAIRRRFRDTLLA